MPTAASLAVCSWSLRPTSPEDLAEKVLATGLRHVQLAFRPFVEGAWSVDAARRALARAGIRVVSGMMEPVGEDYSTPETIKETGGLRPDRHWEANLAVARKSTACALAFGVELVTFHAGFLVEEPAAERAKLIDRIRAVCDVFASARVRVGLETGQETADGLLHALREIARPRLAVNFDPANMILYGMGDPIDALRKLWPHVRQVHVKDAKPAVKKGDWGVEVPVGTGDVDWDRFFGVLRDRGAVVNAAIEREAGERRVEDVRTAVELVGRVAGILP
jgi:L-ribulose-5-phosphate 3-epimerase